MTEKKSMRERFLKSTYFSKGTAFSASDFTKPIYQLWVSKHFEIETKPEMSFKAALGSAFHAYCEDQEVAVIKEFSHITQFEGVSIGGTADLLEFDTETNKWVIGDHKTKGVFQAKKFLGFTRPITKTRKKEEVVTSEQEKEVKQLSIYKWLFKDLFNIADYATIYLWVIGHDAAAKSQGVPEFTEVKIQLIPEKNIEQFIKRTIEIVNTDTPPSKDCEDWLCGYCEYNKVCPAQKLKNSGGFSNLS